MFKWRRDCVGTVDGSNEAMTTKESRKSVVLVAMTTSCINVSKVTTCHSFRNGGRNDVPKHDLLSNVAWQCWPPPIIARTGKVECIGICDINPSRNMLVKTIS